MHYFPSFFIALNKSAKPAQIKITITDERSNKRASIIERARVEAELEKQKVADEVKKEMVSIASIMAGKVVSAKVDVTVQDSLVEETLKEIGDSTWLS